MGGVLLTLDQLTDSALACYRFTKAELHDQGTCPPMLVVYDGKALTLGQLAAPEMLRWSLAEMTDKTTQAVVFHADTVLTWLDPLGLPDESAQCLLTIGATKDELRVRGTVYFATPGGGLSFEDAPALDLAPFQQEVQLLKSIFE